MTKRKDKDIWSVGPLHRSVGPVSVSRSRSVSCFAPHLCSYDSNFDGFLEAFLFICQDFESEADFFAGRQSPGGGGDAERGAGRNRRTKDLEMTFATTDVGEREFSVERGRDR